MSKITALTIQKSDKQRCNLFVDGAFLAGISVETAYKHDLRVDKEIDLKELKEIILEGEKALALSKAIAYISKTIKTKIQVKNYLLGKGFTEEVCWYVVDKLKEYGYIDDIEYSKKYFESTRKTQGKRLADYRLMAKGVKKEDIEKAREDLPNTEMEDAFNLAVKHLRNKELTKENLAKTYRYLIGRGFSYESAENAISKFKDEI